jgi:arylsulfatase A-like enzyme
LLFAYRNVQRAVRDDRWKLIRCPQVDRTQPFDLANDPHETTNLADKPEHAARERELRAALAEDQARGVPSSGAGAA